MLKATRCSIFLSLLLSIFFSFGVQAFPSWCPSLHTLCPAGIKSYLKKRGPILSIYLAKTVIDGIAICLTLEQLEDLAALRDFNGQIDQTTCDPNCLAHVMQLKEQGRSSYVLEAILMLGGSIVAFGSDVVATGAWLCGNDDLVQSASVASLAANTIAAAGSWASNATLWVGDQKYNVDVPAEVYGSVKEAIRLGRAVLAVSTFTGVPALIFFLSGR